MNIFLSNRKLGENQRKERENTNTHRHTQIKIYSNIKELNIITEVKILLDGYNSSIKRTEDKLMDLNKDE